MWGEELCGMRINRGDLVLVLGARTTDKYGVMQLNVSAENGKVIVNPQGYLLPEWAKRQTVLAPVKPAGFNPEEVLKFVQDLKEADRERLSIFKIIGVI
jgi:hypothetical protein